MLRRYPAWSFLLSIAFIASIACSTTPPAETPTSPPAPAADAASSESSARAAVSEDPKAGDPSRVVNGPVAQQLVADGAALVDVRSPEEFAEGHIEGAKNIPVSEIASRMSEIPKDQKVVTYCASGRRAQQAATTLRENGYEVYELGPMSAWDEE